METTSLNPSDFIRFIEHDPLNSNAKVVAVTVKLPIQIERRWRTHCDRHGLHRMRHLRDVFASALADSLTPRTNREALSEDVFAEAPASAASGAPREQPNGLQDRWAEYEAENARRERAAAPNSDSDVGF